MAQQMQSFDQARIAEEARMEIEAARMGMERQGYENVNMGQAPFDSMDPFGVPVNGLQRNTRVKKTYALSSAVPPSAISPNIHLGTPPEEYPGLTGGFGQRDSASYTQEAAQRFQARKLAQAQREVPGSIEPRSSYMQQAAERFRVRAAQRDAMKPRMQSTASPVSWEPTKESVPPPNWSPSQKFFDPFSPTSKRKGGTKTMLGFEDNGFLESKAELERAALERGIIRSAARKRAQEEKERLAKDYPDTAIWHSPMASPFAPPRERL